MKKTQDLLRDLMLRDLGRSSDADAAEALSDLAASLPDTPAPSGLLGRLRASVAQQPFAPFAPPLASLFDVDEATARRYLDRIPDDDAWEAMGPGIRLLHFDGGPATAGADVGFVHVEGEIDFPAHRHDGEERNLILRGHLVEPDGTSYGPGDVFDHPAGSHHRFRTSGDLVFAVVVWGVTFDGPDEA